MKIRIAVNGLGRIGRCIVRAIYELGYSNQIELVAINTPSNIEQVYYLLKYDSIYGKFNFSINHDDKNIIIDNKKIKFSSEKNINCIKWNNVDIVLECSGHFNQYDLAVQHLTSGAKKVIVSAPVKGADKTIICGVNENDLHKDHNVISIGSCTTNCLAPIVSLLHKKIGINNGFATTIHSYTNDQNLLDNSHKKDFRRGRAASLSMIPTSTGAAKMIGEIIPELNNKIDGSAIRVPTPNVSLIDFKFTSMKHTNISDLNKIFIHEQNNKNLSNILGICNEPLVSIDFIHSQYSAIVDLTETSVVDHDFCRIIAWYDNEWGFSARMLDVSLMLCL